MSTARKVRRLGRPPKPESEKWNQSIYVRASSRALKDAIVLYQQDHAFVSESEAVRQLVIKALRADGRM